MKVVILHYKDDNGVVRDTTWTLVADNMVEHYLRCYLTSDRVVARVRPAKPGDAERDRRRFRRVLQGHLRAAA